jgi:hypothetical protein
LVAAIEQIATILVEACMPHNPVIQGLSLAEKYELLDALVVAIHEQEKDSPLADWQLNILKERLDALQSDPHQSQDAYEFLAELERE